MDKKRIISELVRLQVLTVRWIERNTNLKCVSLRDLERVLTKNKLTCTYEQSILNLNEIISTHCKESSYLKEEGKLIEKYIRESSLKDLRFGLDPQRKFSIEENELDFHKTKRTLYMINGMIEIKSASEILDISESTIKQACQQERLLNTRKLGKTWLVHIPECRAYWQVKNDEEIEKY